MGTALESHLIACVQESLSLYLYDNAKFLCERLVAVSATEVRKGPADQQHDSEWTVAVCCTMLPTCVQLCDLQTNIYLLAVCYYQANQAYRAYHLLKNTGARGGQGQQGHACGACGLTMRHC